MTIKRQRSVNGA